MKSNFSLSRPISALVAAALCAGLAVPAQAALGNGNARGSAQAEAGTDDRAVREREICVRADFTGSRVRRLICKTEAEWEADGGLPSE